MDLRVLRMAIAKLQGVGWSAVRSHTRRERRRPDRTRSWDDAGFGDISYKNYTAVCLLTYMIPTMLTEWKASPHMKQVCIEAAARDSRRIPLAAPPIR